MRAIVAAFNKNYVIGDKGRIPWREPEDFKRFKQTTMGGTLIMGRRTYQEIGKPLPGRKTIVVSRTMVPQEGILVAPSLTEAVEMAEDLGRDVFFCGGRDIYEMALAMELAQEAYLTFIEGDERGDTLFPQELMSEDWELENIETIGRCHFTKWTYLAKFKDSSI